MEAARSLPYDHIPMNVMMPEMDGVAATRTMRALPGAQGLVPVVGPTAGDPPAETIARTIGAAAPAAGL